MKEKKSVVDEYTSYEELELFILKNLRDILLNKDEILSAIKTREFIKCSDGVDLKKLGEIFDGLFDERGALKDKEQIIEWMSRNKVSNLDINRALGKANDSWKNMKENLSNREEIIISSIGFFIPTEIFVPWLIERQQDLKFVPKGEVLVAFRKQLESFINNILKDMHHLKLDNWSPSDELKNEIESKIENIQDKLKMQDNIKGVEVQFNKTILALDNHVKNLKSSFEELKKIKYYPCELAFEQIFSKKIKEIEHEIQNHITLRIDIKGSSSLSLSEQFKGITNLYKKLEIKSESLSISKDEEKIIKALKTIATEMKHPIIQNDIKFRQAINSMVQKINLSDVQKTLHSISLIKNFVESSAVFIPLSKQNIEFQHATKDKNLKKVCQDLKKILDIESVYEKNELPAFSAYRISFVQHVHQYMNKNQGMGTEHCKTISKIIDVFINKINEPGVSEEEVLKNSANCEKELKKLFEQISSKGVESTMPTLK